MKNDEHCEACQMAVTAGTAEQEPHLAEHLAGCPECRAFAEFSNRVMQCEPVVPEHIPELSAIRFRVSGGVLRMRRMAVRVLGMAAALAVAAAAVFYPRLTGPGAGTGQMTAVLSGTENGAESVWYENMVDTPVLAWDSRSAAEADFADTMANLRRSGGWNIELFNPIAEEM